MKTRFYALGDCDAHSSKFDAHGLSQFVRPEESLPEAPLVFTASDSLQSLPILSPIQDTRNRSHFLQDDASNGGSHNSTKLQTRQKSPLFDLSDLSDLSDSDLAYDKVTDALNISPSTTPDKKPRSHSMSNKGTRCSPLSSFSLKSETVSSPTLAFKTISTHKTDAFDEDVDEDIIIVQHIPATSFTHQNKSLDETIQAPGSVYDSLFTPPPSEAEGDPSTPDSSPPFKPRRSRIFSPPSRKTKTVFSHVLVPPPPRPKSEYVKMSSFVTLKPRKRLRRTRLKDPPIDDPDIVFVTRTVKETPGSGKDSFIDLTLGDDDDDDDEAIKPIQLLSEPTESITHVPKSPTPDRELVAEETQIRIGAIYSVSYRTLLFNTRFVRCQRGELTDPKDLPVGLSLPIRRRRALLDNVLEMSSTPEDAFSIGLPVVREFERKGIDDDNVNSEDELIELLDPSSGIQSPVPNSPRGQPPPAVPPGPPLPKIDLAAKFRNKKTKARRTSSLLTPSVKKLAPPALSSVSRLAASSLQKTQDVVMDDASYSAHTPKVPSAKALGKRKDSDLQPTRPSSSRLPVVTPEYQDNSFDLFINFGPPSPVRNMALTDNQPSHYFDGVAYGYPDLYPNLVLPSTMPNVTTLDHRLNQPNTFSSVEPTEPAAALLYHSDDYISRPPDDFIPVIDPSLATVFPTWPSVPEPSISYDGGTVNPSLLGGETLGMLEPPELCVSDVGHEFVDSQQEDHGGLTKTSPSRSPSASLSLLSSTPKSEYPRVRKRKRIHVRDSLPPNKSKNMPNDEKQGRRRFKRTMPDMVAFSELSLSSDSESEEEEDGKAAIVLKQRIRSKHSKSRTKSFPIGMPPSSAELNMNGPTVAVGGQLWPMQDEASYCHQCRNKTTVLKIGCRDCNKSYCVRCLITRYPDEPRAMRTKEMGCPACLDYCNCTGCCKKRGVVYISTRDAMAGGVASRARLSAPTKTKYGSSSVPSSVFPSPAPDVAPPSNRSPSPVYALIPLTPADGIFWGTIYGPDGTKIGGGFNFKKQDLVRESRPDMSTSVTADTTDALPPRKKRRVFAGIIHPSWEFEKAVKQSVLDPVPKPKRVHQSRQPRQYVGNKAFLFYKSARMVRELADLSPLSSVEDDWEEEDDAKEDDEWEGRENNGVDHESQRGWRESSERSLTDCDLKRAIGMGLHACGIKISG